MRPGFLHSPNSRSSAAATAAMTLTAVAGTSSVDNLLAAAAVRDRLAAGAKPLRIECDFVTCSQ